MLKKESLKPLVIYICLVVIIVTYFKHGVFLDSLLLDYGIISAAVIGGIMAYDKYLWCYFPFRYFTQVPPFINGTWKGTLASNWINPDTGRKIEPITCYIRIKQHFSCTYVRLMTKESYSDSIIARMVKLEDGSCRLYSLYQNIPKVDLRDRSPIHHGAFDLIVTEKRPYSLDGTYWTDRNTTGKLTLHENNSSLVNTFEDAQKLFE